MFGCGELVEGDEATRKCVEEPGRSIQFRKKLKPEMEKDAIVAHGMSEFTKERLMECSDSFSCYSCKECGLLAIANPVENIWLCRGCNNTTNFARLQIPYASKLLMQELETMNIGSRLITSQKLITHKQ
jgi:DNA-directed RNA polymerase beta subunit